MIYHCGVSEMCSSSVQMQTFLHYNIIWIKKIKSSTEILNPEATLLTLRGRQWTPSRNSQSDEPELS